MASVTFYLSPHGSDEYPGTDRGHPLGSVNHAVEAAREAAAAGNTVTVEFLRGTYTLGIPVDGKEPQRLALNARDRGVSYVTHEGAVLTGGISIPLSESEEPSEEFKALLSEDAAAHVRAIDLNKYGVPPSAYAGPYPIGFTTAKQYDDFVPGINLEVFEGDARMRLARYPNEGFLKLTDILDVGEPAEFPEHNPWEEWDEKRNPRGGAYIFDRETQERALRWKRTENVWILGYLYHDWAESSTQVRVDAKHRALYPKHVAMYGARPGAEFYFFNIPEELDVPGEWYIDREAGMLYVYPSSPDSVISLSVYHGALVSFSGAEDVTVSGFTLECTAGTAIVGGGKRLLLEKLYIHNVGQYAAKLRDCSDTVVDRCEVAHTGGGGISVDGGDRDTLTHGNHVIKNCYVHDFSEVARTYAPGLSVGGVGGTIAHCEVCRTPHMAMSYGGNEHLIEYNYIHDVVLHSADAGAIYSGADWAGHGNVIRYNRIENVGSDELAPDGLYWDDTLSGQTGYGNIIINVRKFGVIIGGGRDNVLRENLVIGESTTPLQYDDRARDGVLHNGWARKRYETPDTDAWKSLGRVPRNSDIWAKKYPTLARISFDFGNMDDPDFPINPSYSVVENNIFINPAASCGYIAESVYTYGHVGVNHAYHSCEEADFDMETLHFRHPRPDFPEIPVEKIGIEKE